MCTRTVFFLGSTSHTNRTPASKYSPSLRFISARVLLLLSTSTARSGASKGIATLGRLRPGNRSQEVKATSGMRTRPANSLIVPSAPVTMPSLRGRTKMFSAVMIEAGDIGLLITHRLLHQGPLDQLAQPILSVEDLDHILLGRGAGGRMQAHAPGRDVSQPLQEVADRGRGLARRG